MEDSCPATPLILTGRDSKSPIHEAISSPESDGMKSPSRDSPDSRCVICLGKLQNKSFTDSCLHQFCFQCLLQWSKVKAECPLCKQPFKSIIHNVRSNLDYDQYHVEHGEPRYVISDLMHSYNFDLIPINRRFRYRSTMTHDYFRELAESFLASTRGLPENSYQINPLVPVDPTPTPRVRRSSRIHSTSSQYRIRQRGASDFRRNIYTQDLWVQDLADISGRYRECTPQFYRQNPAQIHRIVPWLNREVNALLSDRESHAAYVLSRIISLLTQYPIRSREFREQIQTYFGDRTDHFVHELYTFARSVYDIAGFDQNAVYSTNPNYATEVQEILSSSTEDSEIEILETIKSEERITKKSSQKLKDTRQGLKKLLLNRVNDAEPKPDEPVAGPSGITSTRARDSIDICDSDTDEVKVLEYVKPEPEVVILSSGEDTQAYSDLEKFSGEYAEVIHPKINKSKQSSQRENEKKQIKVRYGKGKCKSNGFGLKGKQKRKHIKSKKHRSSSTSSTTSSRSSSRSSSTSSNTNDSTSSSNINSSSYSDSDRNRNNKSRSNIRNNSLGSDGSTSDSSLSSRSSYKSFNKTKRKKSSFSRKKSKRKVSSKSSEKHKSSTEVEEKKKKRVKSCVIVPNWLCDSSFNNRRNSPEPKRLQSYWSIALGNTPHRRLEFSERKSKRKYRDSSSEDKSTKRSKRESTSSERTSVSRRSQGTGSPAYGSLPSTCPSSTSFSWPVKSGSNSD